jgi:hypothetical protein
MLRLEWNALRVGDKVFVHDASDAELRLVPGVVAIVESAKGSGDIGIRIAPDRDVGGRVVRPRRLTVHLDPVDPTQPCWRCDAIVAGMADRKQRVSAGVP